MQCMLLVLNLIYEFVLAIVMMVFSTFIRTGLLIALSILQERLRRSLGQASRTMQACLNLLLPLLLSSMIH